MTAYIVEYQRKPRGHWKAWHHNPHVPLSSALVNCNMLTISTRRDEIKDAVARLNAKVPAGGRGRFRCRRVRVIEPRKGGLMAESHRIQIDEGQSIDLAVDAKLSERRVTLSVPWHHTSLTINQAYDLIRALLKTVRAAQEKPTIDATPRPPVLVAKQPEDAFDPRFSRAMGLMRELERRCEADVGQDMLMRYRAWLDANDIPAEDNGWPSERAYSEVHIGAFVEYWRARHGA